MTLKEILVTATVVITAAMGTTAAARERGGEPAATTSDECKTIQPGPGWVCVAGGWLPPDMPITGSVAQPAPAPPVPSAVCTSVQPGPGWTCFGGGWLPPGMPIPSGATNAVPASAPTPQAFGACTTPQPGPGWNCFNGGWLPPGMPVPGRGASVAAPAQAPQEAPAPVAVEQAPSAPAQNAPVASDSNASGGSLRVMTWNIKFGSGDPSGQVREIANSGADVVMLQEVSTWDEYMPATYADRLGRLTGQTWYTVWAPHGGRYTDNEGTLILSRLPLVDQSTMNSNERGFSRAVVNVGGVNVTLLNAHLDWDTSMRSAQLGAFMSWGREVGGPRIAGGDFNSWWDEWWIHQLEGDYSDTWQDVTGSDENGYTLNGSVRFDYLFRSHDQGSRLIPTNCWVQATGLSDHAAVIADYVVR